MVDSQDDRPEHNATRMQFAPADLIIIPVLLFFGVHVSIFSIWMSKKLKIPLMATMLVIYGLLLVPVWIFQRNIFLPANLLPAIVTCVVLIVTAGIFWVYSGKTIAEEGNVEACAPPHALLVMGYICIL